MYSYNAEVRRWNAAMAAIAGFCGVVALGSIASLIATPSTTLYAPAMTTVRPTVATMAPVYQARAVRDTNVAYAQNAENVVAEPVYVSATQASSSWVPLAGLLAVPAAVVAFMMRQSNQAKIAAVGVGAAALLGAQPALAADVKLGGDNGELAFVPSSVTIKAGDTVTWTNNAGYPHNIVFDEDEIPDGANAGALSHEDYLNAKGQQVSSKFDTPGSYSYYCEPHQGAGMQGKVIVQ